MSLLFPPDRVEMFAQPIVGMVEEKITHHNPGRVRCQGTSWPARFYRPEGAIMLQPDALVSVVACQGITLLVIPVKSAA